SGRAALLLSSIRMYLPRRETPVIVAPFNLRLKREGEGLATSLGSRISLATMRRPETTGRRARTTCSTSGNSGIGGSVSLAATQSQSSLPHVVHYLRAPVERDR